MSTTTRSTSAPTGNALMMAAGFNELNQFH